MGTDKPIRKREAAIERAAEEYYEYKEGMAFIKESFIAGAHWMPKPGLPKDLEP